MQTNMLWYKEPAKEWTDSLPLGNGRIGAMVFGGVFNERIALNEDTLWSGYPVDKNNPNAAKCLEHARKLAYEGKYEELSEYVEGNMLGDYTESYLPLGDLFLLFPESEDLAENYYRDLNMNNAIATTRFSLGDCEYYREAFVSHEAQAYVMKLGASKPGRISFSMSFASQLRAQVRAEASSLVITGLCPSHVEPSYLYSENPIIYEEDPAKKGIRFGARAAVVAKGGAVSTNEATVTVENADEVIITFTVRSSFNGYNKQPYLEGKDYQAELLEDAKKLEGIDYADLLCRHEQDFRSYFERVDFYLEPDNYEDIPTDERLERFEKTQDDKELYKLLFQYGRYLLISSSRPGTQPANLQGIWNQELRAPWSSNYTLNINAEMNYWLAENCNLSEFHEPFLEFILKLRDNGARTARLHYGADGAVSHHNSDIWCMTNPVGRTDRYSIGYAYWCMSFGWLCRHLFSHYEYTNDIEYLRKKVYPTLKLAAEFYLCMLTEDVDGSLIIAPSTSPENAYLLDGKRICVSKTTTMTTSIVREVFSEIGKCSDILNISDEFTKKVSAALTKLPEYKIGKKGQLMEWDADYEDAEETHRHISHLYPLYPGEEITPDKTPELANACRKTLEIRGDGGTGWSL